MSNDQNEEWLSGEVPLSMAGKTVMLRVVAPASVVPPRRALSVFQRITDAVVSIATKQLEESGKTLSCRVRCGACCRELVPIAAMEAFHLRDLIEEMPDARKASVRDRFAAATEKLEAAGLLEDVRRARELAIEDRQRLGDDYRRLQIACPFLEEESCSIYQMRPLACREHLVTSPAENCAGPKDNIEGVSLPVKVSAVVSSLGSEPPNISHEWIPLILALEWTETHEEDSPTRTGPEWVDEVIERISSASQG